MIIDNRYYRIKSIFGYRLRALLTRVKSRDASQNAFGCYKMVGEEIRRSLGINNTSGGDDF